MEVKKHPTTKYRRIKTYNKRFPVFVLLFIARPILCFLFIAISTTIGGSMSFPTALLMIGNGSATYIIWYSTSRWTDDKLNMYNTTWEEIKD